MSSEATSYGVFINVFNVFRICIHERAVDLEACHLLHFGALTLGWVQLVLPAASPSSSSSSSPPPPFSPPFPPPTPSYPTTTIILLPCVSAGVMSAPFCVSTDAL